MGGRRDRPSRIGALAALLVLATISARAVELKSVAVSISDFTNPFFVQLARSVEQAVAKIASPDARVIVLSNSYDLAAQIRQIERFIADPVQMIILNAADPEGVAPVIRKAARAGIVVIAVDVAATGASATVTSDNVPVGPRRL